MGEGYTLICKECGYDCEVFEGIGLYYSSVCEEILSKMKKGKFGEEFMSLANNTMNVAVHQENTLFICDKCGNIEMGEIIDLCQPIKNHHKDGRQYVMSLELDSIYKIIKSKRNKCRKCKNDLRPVRTDEELRCPVCSKLLVKDDFLYWD